MNTLPPIRRTVDPDPVALTSVDHGGLKSTPHKHNSQHHHAHHPWTKPAQRLSVLAWPAWRRVLAVLPLVLALWLAVWWAHMGATPW